jgi:hypothetical protein
VAQIFTASGNTDNLAIERVEDAAVVNVPACDAAVLHVSRGE